MKINQATDYAFRALLLLASQPEGTLLDAHSIAQEQVIPMRFLLKIMPSLIKAGLISSQRGVGGGYSLAQNPQEITFLAVVEAIEGPVHLNKCLEDYSYCSRNGAPQCRVHQAFTSIQDTLVKELLRHNISELID